MVYKIYFFSSINRSVYFQICNVFGKMVTAIVSRSTFRRLSTLEVKIALVPVLAFTGNKMASKRNVILTS